MYRREFMSRLSQALALASTATVHASVSRDGKYASGATGPADVEDVLRRVDEINTRIDTDRLFDAPSAHCSAQGLDASLIRDSLKAMLLIGTFGDLSEEDRAHPRMQQRMLDSADLFDRTVIGCTTLIERTSREQRRRVRRTLQNNPDIGKAFQMGVDDDGRRTRVPHQRLTHFHTLWNRTVSALQRRNCSTIVDEYVEKVDRAGSRCGISSERRRSLAMHWDGELVESLALEASGLGDIDTTQVAAAGYTDVPVGAYSPKRHYRRIGYSLLGVSGGFTLLGGFFLFLGGISSMEGFFVAALISGTVAAVVLLIAMVFGIIAAASPSTSPNVTPSVRRGSAYKRRVADACAWVGERKAKHKGRLEDLVAEASLTFKVNFNDIWTALE